VPESFKAFNIMHQGAKKDTFPPQVKPQ